MKLSESQALARIAAYCSKAERCTFDVKKKLTLWAVDPEATARILERLKKEDFINEGRFCEGFVRDKMRFNKWGKIKIVFELNKKQISTEIIESTFDRMEDNPFGDILLGILQVKLKSIKAENDYQRRTKLVRFALSRGFTMDQIIRCINKLLTINDEDNFY